MYSKKPLWKLFQENCRDCIWSSVVLDMIYKLLKIKQKITVKTSGMILTPRSLSLNQNHLAIRVDCIFTITCKRDPLLAQHKSWFFKISFKYVYIILRKPTLIKYVSYVSIQLLIRCLFCFYCSFVLISYCSKFTQVFSSHNGFSIFSSAMFILLWV